MLMRFASGGNVGFNAPSLQGLDRGWAEIVAIHRHRFGAAQFSRNGGEGRQGLGGINRMVGQAGGDNQQAGLLHRRLSVVMLIKAVVGTVFHNGRVRVGEIVLIAGACSRHGRLRSATARFVPALLRFLFSLAHFIFIFGLLRFVSGLRPFFYDCLGLGQVDQPVLAKADFGVDVQADWQISLIDLVGQGQQFLDFGLQSGYQFRQVGVADRFAFGGIGVDLASIQTNIAQGQYPRFLGNDQYLHKQGRHLRQKGLPKVGYCVVVRVQPTGNIQRAIGFLEQALAIATEIGDRAGEGRALGNLGLVYHAMGNTEQAIQYYEQQLTITREIRDRQGEGNALGNLGNAYSDLGNTQRAIERYEQSLAIIQEVGNIMSVAMTNFNFALLLFKQGQLAEALCHAEFAAQVFVQTEYVQGTQQAQRLIAQILRQRK